jgi:hypothetical protein
VQPLFKKNYALALFRRHAMMTVFGNFDTLLGENIGYFIGKQCYDCFVNKYILFIQSPNFLTFISPKIREEKKIIGT